MVGSARGRAYGARWLRTPRAAVLACTILASSATLRAQDAPLIAQLGAAGPEQVVVQLVLNQEKKGEYFVAVVEGKFLARTQDLLAAGVPVAGARTMVTGGNEYVWIDSIPGVQASFDEARLALNLVADPKLLPVKTIDLWAGRFKAYAEGQVPGDLAPIDRTGPPEAARDVYAFVIHEGKVRAPAAAMEFIKRVDG